MIAQKAKTFCVTMPCKHNGDHKTLLQVTIPCVVWTALRNAKIPEEDVYENAKVNLDLPFWASITQLLRMSHDRLRNQPWSKPKIRYMLVWKNIARGQIHVDRICEYLNVWSVTWRLRHALLMAFSTSSSLSL